MALIKSIQGISPVIESDVYLAETATVIGDVRIGESSSIWFNAVLRGDVNAIRIGKGVNIQDNAMVHCTYNRTNTVIEDFVSIGHNAIVHGCTIKENALVGMGAIVMDNAVVGKNSIIAAGAVILENTVVEPNTIWAGVPAKKVKDITQHNDSTSSRSTADAYMKYKAWY